VTTTDAEIAPGMLAGTRIAAILSAATGWSLVTTSPVPTP
jgi:hypothetical protein